MSTFLVVSPNGIPWSHTQMTQEEAEVSKANAERRMRARGYNAEFSIVPADVFERSLVIPKAEV